MTTFDEIWDLQINDVRQLYRLHVEDDGDKAVLVEQYGRRMLIIPRPPLEPGGPAEVEFLVFGSEGVLIEHRIYEIESS